MKHVRPLVFGQSPDEAVIFPAAEIDTIDAGGEVQICSMPSIVTAMMARGIGPMKILRKYNTMPYPITVHMN